MISRRALLTGALAGLPWAAAAPAVADAAAWSAPVRLGGPWAGALGRPVIAISPRGEVAAAVWTFAVDNQGNSQGWLTTGRWQRMGRARRLGRGQRPLALGFSGKRLVLLEASGTGASLLGFGAPRGVGQGFSGPAEGRLVALPGGRMLAAVASSAGVWVRAGRSRRLSAKSASPSALAVSATAAGRPAVAWLTGGRAVLSWGTASSRTALRPRRGHQFDELGLASRGPGVTVGLIESWFDRRGSYHSVVRVSGRRLTVAGQNASDLVLSGDGRGGQLLAFKSCEAAGRCWVRAAYRRPRGGWSGLERLGAVDPGAAPAGAMSAGGVGAVAWIYGGRLFVVWRGPRARRFGPGRALTRSRYVSAVALAGGPGGQVIAAWTQGTLDPTLVGAALR